MKSLDVQIQVLIDNAPQDGVTPSLVTTIAPVLKAIAQKLKHSQYYILQNLQEHWVLTTLKPKAHRSLEKRIVYAFPSLQDVALSSPLGLVDPQTVPKLMPVIHILFQLVALEPVDSIVFFETPGTTTNATEVQRTDLQVMIQQKLQQHISGKQVPPDIA
jgi:hypothetical protein